MRLLMLLVAVEWVGLGCSCFSGGSACTGLWGKGAVFVGRVEVDSGPGWGERRARVRVEEALRNVPDGLEEVEVDSMPGTSCHYRLEAGQRYVIYATRRNEGGQFEMGACSHTFPVAGHEHLLRAVREAAKGGGASIVGQVKRRVGEYGRGTGVAGARVVARSGERAYEAVTDGSGAYEMRAVEPGRYRFTVTREGFVADEQDAKQWDGLLRTNAATGRLERGEELLGSVEVSAGGCAVWDLGLWANGAIAGTVRGADGRGVAGVEVRVYRVDEKDRRGSDALKRAVTDRAGGYRVAPVPAGEYEVGVNADRYADNDAYAPVVSGERIRLEEGGERRGVDLQVGAKRRALRLRVRVLDEGGRPRAGAGLRLDDPAGEQRWFAKEKTDEEGWLEAPVWEGEEYVVKSWHFEIGRNGKASEEQGEARYRAVAEQGEVTIVLKAVQR